MKIIIIIALLFFFGCNTSTNKPTDPTANKKRISELESASGIKFPTDAEILLDEDAGRIPGEIQLTVIHSKSKIDSPAKDITQIQASSDSDTSLHRILSDKKIGKLKDKNLYIGEWENQKGRWRSTLSETETGFYLELENFKLIK